LIAAGAMPNFQQLTPEYWEARRREWSGYFSGAQFGWPGDATAATLEAFHAALKAGPEEAIQEFLTGNPYLIQYALDHSGHHGIWVFPKQMIKPHGADGSKGLAPDYLVATRSSLGYFWNVVELKGFDQQFANQAGDAFSPEGNRALTQCNSYLTHFKDYIDAIRTNICVQELIQPEGAILLMGNSAAESETQRTFRANFSRNHAKIKVVSYQRIIGALELDLRSSGRAKQ
jgi:Domain of unknown function (DUF4263)